MTCDVSSRHWERCSLGNELMLARGRTIAAEHLDVLRLDLGDLLLKDLNLVFEKFNVAFAHRGVKVDGLLSSSSSRSQWRIIRTVTVQSHRVEIYLDHRLSIDPRTNLPLKFISGR